MTNPVFPSTIKGFDSKGYKVAQEDPALKTKMDGGYVVSRAKHTRKPRKTFSVGYTKMPSSDKAVLQGFYDSMCGGSVIFDWTDPSSDIVYQVRFAGESLEFKYVGIGTTQLWDVAFQLEQA